MKIKLVLFFIVIALFFKSCNFDNPKSYIGKTVLNTNRYIKLGAQEINDMKAKKKANLLQIYVDNEFKSTDSYETYVRESKINIIKEDIEKVKTLKVTSETKNLINASLTVYNTIKKTYEEDYIKISKLLDLKAPEADINIAIEHMENTLSVYDSQLKTLMQIAKSYADKNGIKNNFGDY